MATRITVNEKVYDNVDAMPPDVRAIYEQAMRAASTAGPVVKHSEIKVTFQMGGPHFKFHVGSGAVPAVEPPAPADPVTSPVPLGTDAPRPIEPASGSVALVVALVVAAGLAIGLGFWYWASAH